jgi:5'-3' exonuclease
MAPVTGRLMLLDTASLYYRAYYGMPENLTSPQGEPVNAIRGVLDMTARLIAQYRPQRFAACLDLDWRPEWRVALIPSYKSHRVAEEETALTPSGESVTDEMTPDTLAPQIPVIFEAFAAFGLQMAGAEEFEADDVIATLAHREPGPTDVVTGDRDLFQLVDDRRDVRVLYPARGISGYEEVTEAWVSEKYGIPGHLYAAFATLRGDSSDGLPGVRGIGEKSAAHLVSTFGDIADIQAAALDAESNIASGLRAKIIAGTEYLAVAPEVVRCAPDVPLAPMDLKIDVEAIDRDAIAKLKDRWGIGASADRLSAVLLEGVDR